jgi:hypothetical protein
MDMSQFAGKRIQQSSLVNPIPKLKLKLGDYCSDEMRKDMDKYLHDMFGEYYPVYEMGNTLIMHPTTYQALRRELDKANYQCN